MSDHTSVQDILNWVLTAAGTAFLGWITTIIRDAWAKWTLNNALGRASGLVISKIMADPDASRMLKEFPPYALKIGVDYLIARIPGKIKQFSLTPADLEKMVEAETGLRLGAVQAALPSAVTEQVGNVSKTTFYGATPPVVTVQTSAMGTPVATDSGVATLG